MSPTERDLADAAEALRPQGAAAFDRPLRLLLAERARWGLWAPVAIGLGIAVYFALASEPPPWLGVAILGFAALFALAGRRQPAALLLGLAALVVGGGFTAAQLRTAQVAQPMLGGEIGPVPVTGQVVSREPRGEGGRGPRLILQHLEIARLAPEETPARVRLRATAKDPAAVAPGDWVEVLAVLRPPPPPAAPGAFDFARQLYFRGIGGVGYAVGHLEGADPPAVAGAPGWRERAALAINGVRARVTARIRAALPGTPGAVAAALITGERAAIPEPVIEAMRGSGLAHLLAISGLHVGLVTAILFFGLRTLLALVPPLALAWPIKKWAAVAAALGALCYLLLAGATVPTQRAFIMVLIVLTGVVLDRTAISLRLVAWAAGLILLLTPEALLSASFQMSFAATTALVAAYEALRRRRDRLGIERAPGLRPALYLGGVALTSVIAICATAPFAVYHFNRFATFGLIANLLAVPLTAFWIMPWAVAALLLMPFGLEALALVPMGWGLELLVAWARMITGWPGAVVPVAAMAPWGLALVALGGLWLCLWSRPWRLAGLLAVALGFAAIPIAPRPDLLVGGDARLFALRDGAGDLRLSTDRRARFQADVWLRRNGQTDKRLLPEAGALDAPAEPRIGCDPLGCLADFAGAGRLAVVRDGRALAEDCATARVVVSLIAVPRGTCRGPEAVVDFWDLRRDGAHAIRLSGGDVELRSVAVERGRRPWSGGEPRPAVSR